MKSNKSDSTQGDWKATGSLQMEGYREGEVISSTNQKVAVVKGITPEEYQANVNLISASPDMYETLKEIRNHIESNIIRIDNARYLKFTIEKALAKAEGK